MITYLFLLVNNIYLPLVMSRKDKQADLRRRMAEARSKLLAQSSIKGDEEEVVEKKRKLSHETVGGVGGILRKSKYTTQQPGVASKQNTSSSHPQNALTSSIGALVDYGESSSDEDNVQEVDKNSNRVVKSSINAVVKTNTAPSFQSTKIIEENNKQLPQVNNKIESSTSKQIIPEVQEKEISDEVWDEFNAILDADEAASKVTLDASSASLTKAATSEANDYDQTLLDSKDKSHNKLDQDDIRSNNKKEPPESSKSTKDDLYDNDEVNKIEQSSYEARLARLILLKNKKKKQSGLDNDNDVMEEVDLPSTGEFYDPTLAWAEDDEQDDDDDDDDDNDDKEEKQPSSQPETSTPGLTNAPAAVVPPAVSMADILRRRRDEARMIATRGNDANGEDDISDGNWF
jgi:hypothetical protein